MKNILYNSYLKLYFRSEKKPHYSGFYLLSLVFMSASFLFGCNEKTDCDDLKIDSGPPINVTIITRSNGTSVEYPVYIYVFSSTGAFVEADTINDDSSNLNIKLFEGSYRIAALAGFSDYNIPNNFSLDSQIGYNVGRTYSNTALMSGNVDVVLEDEDVSVDINMSYRVCKLFLRLNDVPDNIEKVSVSFSPLYSSIKFSGEYANENSISKIDCAKTDEGWISDTLHVFPGNSSQTVISITLSTSESSFTYGYTYDRAFASATPYILNGGYKTGFNVSGTLIFEGWNQSVPISFNFGDGALIVNPDEESKNPKDSINNPDPEIPQPPSPDSDKDEYATDTIKVTNLPENGDIVNGAMVLSISDNSSVGETCLLMSVCEWQVASKVSTSGAILTATTEEAVTLINEYSLSGLETGWRLPYVSEIPLMRQGRLDAGTTSELTEILTGAKGVDIKTSLYYLCTDSEKNLLTYKFSYDISYPLSTASEYAARAVKKVYFKL
ncbi:MAG: hypothetical protein Q4F97_05015 [Bacteroidales bacterium]|nr:hypothetical protein [Bacteroidales bacterium]